jgi:adenylate kinase family enzyme
MQTQNIFIAHPKTSEQIEALKAIVKAFKIDFEVTTKEDNTLFIAELQGSLNQVHAIKTGELPKQSIKDFLNEL